MINVLQITGQGHYIAQSVKMGEVFNALPYRKYISGISGVYTNTIIYLIYIIQKRNNVFIMYLAL